MSKLNKKQEEIKEIITNLNKKRYNKVCDFKKKVEATVFIYHKLKELNYNTFSFGKKLSNGGTPDLFAKKGNFILIGDLKENLPKINSLEQNDEDNKKYEKIYQQLKKYLDEKFENNLKQDVFLLSNGFYINEGKKYLMKNFIENDEDLKESFSFLSYNNVSGSSHQNLNIKKDLGIFKDDDLEQQFEYGSTWDIGENQLKELQGRYKIYQTEDITSIPIEYIMFILRAFIFPELADVTNIKSIFLIKKDNKIEINLNIDEIYKIIKRIYLLEYEENKGEQIKKKLLVEAIDKFKKLKVIEEINSKNYLNLNIESSAIDLIKYYVENINFEEFEKQAEEIYRDKSYSMKFKKGSGEIENIE